MRIRRLSIVLGILLMPTAAHADRHDWGLYGGLSRVSASSLWGLHGAAEKTLPWPPSEDLSLVGDFSIQFGDHEGIDITRTSLMGGVRLAFGPDVSHTRAGLARKLVPAVHALVGIAHDDSGADEGSDLAAAFGASLDIIPNGDATGGGWGFRAQVDYIVRKGDADSYPRVSVGVVRRFGH